MAVKAGRKGKGKREKGKGKREKGKGRRQEALCQFSEKYEDSQ
jgi:hypothetical protein